MRRHLGTILCVVAVLGLVGCDDSGDSTVPVTQELLEASVEQSVLPVLQSVQMIPSVGISSPPGITNGIEPGGCERNDCDGGGTMEFCYYPGIGQAFDIDVTFATCGPGPEMMHGTVELTSNGTTASVEYQLAIGDSYIGGTLTQTDDKCTLVGMEALTISSPNLSVVTSANLTYCGEYPDGSMTQTVTGPAGTLTFVVQASSEGTAEIDVSDASGDIAICTANLATDSFSCQMLSTGESPM